MADPELDSGFVYNEQGFVDILRSPFLDVNPEVDNSVEEYLERIIFTLLEVIEEQLSTVQWQITVTPRQGGTLQDVRYYPSFSEMLEVELANALSGIPTVEEGVQIYRKFYTEEKEKSNGVLAIHVLKPASQPYISLGNLLSGLGCEGVGSLLGMMHTVGTVSDALPPPRSYLLSSFMKLHRPNVEGSTLTDAARSLAKHFHRSSEEWWGSFREDSEKNRLASEIVNHLLNECCWMNVYDIQTHNRVFEIRIHEGYGARWSHDGSKFIGFLEPYTEEGHSKGWKH